MCNSSEKKETVSEKCMFSFGVTPKVNITPGVKPKWSSEYCNSVDRRGMGPRGGNYYAAQLNCILKEISLTVRNFLL